MVLEQLKSHVINKLVVACLLLPQVCNTAEGFGRHLPGIGAPLYVSFLLPIAACAFGFCTCAFGMRRTLYLSFIRYCHNCFVPLRPALQIVDDILDLTASSTLLGKPALNNMKSGLATAPVRQSAKAYGNLAYSGLLLI